MEFCGGGTLQGHIRDRKTPGQGFSSFRIFGYLAHLSDGVAYIHSQGVTHRDLKSENIMLTTECNLKISDFGCGKTLPEGSTGAMTMTGGDLMVVPPEFSAIAQGIPQLSLVSPAYDMWGLGCILSEMATLKLMRQDRCHSRPLALHQQVSLSPPYHDHYVHPLFLHNM